MGDIILQPFKILFPESLLGGESISEGLFTKIDENQTRKVFTKYTN